MDVVVEVEEVFAEIVEPPSDPLWVVLSVTRRPQFGSDLRCKMTRAGGQPVGLPEMKVQGSKEIVAENRTPDMISKLLFPLLEPRQYHLPTNTLNNTQNSPIKSE